MTPSSQVSTRGLLIRNSLEAQQPPESSLLFCNLVSITQLNMLIQPLFPTDFGKLKVFPKAHKIRMIHSQAYLY